LFTLEDIERGYPAELLRLLAHEEGLRRRVGGFDADVLKKSLIPFSMGAPY
jgi:hypothetical protein